MLSVESILEGSPIPIFVIDRNHRIILWNRACEELTGFRAGEMIGTDGQYRPFYAEKRPVIADLIVDRDVQGLGKYYGKKQVHQSSVIEGAYEASDFYENLGGKRRHLYFLAAPIYDEKGEIIAAIETLQDVTREREMELSLKEYAETLKIELDRNIRLSKTIEGIIEGTPIPIFVIDRNHRIILWNRACEELTGFRAGEMIGTDGQYLPFYGEKRPVIADLIVNNDIEGLKKYYGDKVVKSSVIEGAYEASDFYENLGGKRRHLYFLATPIYDEKGEIIAAIETLQDVTREREMELSLKEHAESLKGELEKNVQLRSTIEGIIEGSPIPIFVIDRNHRIILWNRACEELTGFRAGEMIGTDGQYRPFYAEKRPVIADLIVDRDVQGLEKYYGKKQVHQSSVIEGAYEASDFYETLGGRKRRHLYFLAAPIYDEKGEIIAAIETLQDVTREREMELNLKEYAETLRNELDENITLRKDIENLYNYLQSILDSSPDRIFDLASDGIIHYVSRDFDTGKMKGRHFSELVDPERRAYLLERWAEIKRGIYKPFEIQVSDKDGSKRDLLITARPIKGTNRFIIVQRDITDFKDLEQKFYDSQKLAAVGQLSAGIAHEVRNPLSSIKMSLQILEKRMNPQGNDLKRFRIAQREVEHLEKLVSDILVFARPAEPEMTQGDINQFLKYSLNLAEKEIADKHIRIDNRFDDKIPPLLFDSAMLKQAFLNLYLNAIDAMEAGGVLSISSRLIDGYGKSVSIEVADNGAGIEENVLPHIFNPFFTTKNYGTGLGLSQVKKIVDLHSGIVGITSKRGAGTKVTITLPVKQS